MKDPSAKRPAAELLLFFALLAGLSAYSYYPMLRAHSIRAGGGTFLLMWSPGIAALVTCLVFRRSLRGFGWWPVRVRWLLLAWALPIACGLAVYALVWGVGLGGFPNPRFLDHVRRAHPAGSDAVSVAKYLAQLMVVSFVPSMLKPLGEEIGWRGFLVPTLARKLSFTQLSLSIGAVWAVWHYPAILFTDYNIGTPAWFAIPCFSAMVIAASFVTAWLRLRSDSVWPSVVWHNSHNAIVQAFFTPVTVVGPSTLYFIDEFGVGLVLAIGLVAWIAWKQGARELGYSRSR